MAAATGTRREKRAQGPHGSASKPAASGGTNEPKTKGSRGGSGGSNGNGRASTNGNGSSGSGKTTKATQATKASKGRAKSTGRANGSARSNAGGTGSAGAGDSGNGSGAGDTAGKANASTGKAKARTGKPTSNARKAKHPVKNAAKATAKKAAKETMETAVDVAEEGTGLSKPKKFAGKLMLKALKRSARKMAEGSLASAAEIVRHTARMAAEKGHDAFANGASNRLPIQRSVDVAVPLQIAWEEWLELDSLPEGVDTVSDIERDGDTLIGHIEGPRSRDWEADVIDEREQQSFAWQSHEGSDCAGLVTFHALSERLTRLELNLDVVPTGVGETLKLSTHLADRRAEAELRRFKARVELINPDVYEDELQQDDEGQDHGEEPDRDDTEDRDGPQDRGEEHRDNEPDDAEEPDAD